ncbi:MAG: GTPase domain-containing protein [Planctomycetaceae bacterium]|nr:GTPase domain-containing protein [Planctomycetaceae bacterium]MCB9953132.1 GTPase domain-containing protein [Planctomycetaceae bacterium]
MKFRQLVIIALLVLPVFVYLAFGIYALWETGWLIWIGWTLPVIWIATWGLSRVWKDTPSSSPAAAASPIEVPGHWTQQDEAGLKIVARHQELVSEVTAEDLIDPHHYLNAALSLAGDLAKHFNRSQEHPVDGVTATEALAAMRLALDDTERWVIANVPGSQLVTIGQWKMLARASKWVEPATKAGWLASSIFNPVNAVNYFISKATLGPVISDVQRELLATVFVRYIRQVGFYLIEMYSGRLKGGADVYRNTFGRKSAAADPTEGSHQELELKSLQIALLGQVKAGKSSLINALLEQQQATTDVLPQTRSVSRYSWTLPGTEEQLTLLDTPGYAEAGATSAQVSEIETAVAEADVVLLVLAANSPARSADVELLKQLQAHYAGRQHLKLPPVIGVLTHIDLLSPVREWNPPYDWRSGQSPKVESIRGAVGYAQEVFGNAVADVVPVCTSDDTSRRTGVMNDLVPAIISQVEAGQSAALLKAYHDRLNSDRLKTFLGQLTSASGSMLRWWVEERFLPSINKGK